MTEEKQKPVKTGDILIIETQEQGRKEDYITRKDDFVIIIKGAKALGERYQVQITRVAATYAFATILRPIKKYK